MTPAGAAAAIAVLVAAACLRLLPFLVADEAGTRLLRLAAERRPGPRVRGAALLLVAAGLGACAPLVVPQGGGAGPVLLAAGWGAAAGASPLLAAIDARIHRLPDRIVLPLLLVVALLWVAVWLTAPEAGAGRAAGAGLVAGPVCGALLLVLSLVGGRGRGLAIGLGDIKLAVLAGLLAGTLGLVAVLAAFLVAQASAVLEAGWRILVRREGASTRLAYGPHLLVGMWTGPVLVALLR